MELERTDQELGIKVYTASPSQYHRQPPRSSTPPPTTPAPPPSSSTAAGGGGKKRRAVAKGVQATLSKTSMLAHFLPTGTLLTFEMVLPSIYGVGECTAITTTMTAILLSLCILSCFFFHFTDSFRAPDGKVYYGLVTHRGLAVFKADLGVEVPNDDKYKANFADFVHALMSVMVFSAIAFSDHRVTHCLLHGHTKEMEEAMESFPLMVGLVCSCLFLVFPKARYGIGCMAT